MNNIITQADIAVRYAQETFQDWVVERHNDNADKLKEIYTTAAVAARKALDEADIAVREKGDHNAALEVAIISGAFMVLRSAQKLHEQG